MAFTLDKIIDPFKSMPGVNRSITLSAYIQKYELIKDRIMCGWVKHNNNYVAHVRIPSSNLYCKNVYYDIVFEFFPGSQKVEESISIKDYSVLLYSNCPSFTFTFTYAYNKYELLIPWMIDKCNPTCLSVQAAHRNKSNIIGADFKTWLAAYHIQKIGILNYKKKFEETMNTNVTLIYEHVLSQTAMLLLRQKCVEEEQFKIKRDKAKPKIIDRLNQYEEKKRAEHEITRRYGGKVNPLGAVKKLFARKAKSARKAKRPR